MVKGSMAVHDDVEMQMAGDDTLDDNAFINLRNTNINQVSVGLMCFHTIKSSSNECPREVDNEEENCVRNPLYVAKDD